MTKHADHWAAIIPGCVDGRWFSKGSQRQAAGILGDCAVRGCSLVSQVPENEWREWQAELYQVAVSAGSFGRRSLHQRTK